MSTSTSIILQTYHDWENLEIKEVNFGLGSVKISDTTLFKNNPSILATPPFLMENQESDPPFLGKL